MLGRHGGSGWLPTGLIFYVLIYCIVYTKNIRFKNKKERFFSTALFLSAVAIVDITIFPIAYNLEAIQHIKESHTFSVNLVPFLNLFNAIRYGYQRVLLEMFLNIVLFIPFGYFVRKTLKYSILKTIIAGLIFTISIELFQLATFYFGFNVRIFDIDDVILNVLGSALGAYFVKTEH